MIYDIRIIFVMFFYKIGNYIYFPKLEKSRFCGTKNIDTVCVLSYEIIV